MRIVPMLLVVAGCAPAPIQPREPAPPVAKPHVSAETGSWSRTWDATEERARLARIGATDASGLEAEYARVCGPSWPPTVSGSPLLRYRLSDTKTLRGASILLSPLAGTADDLLDDIRCHFVGMLLSPFGVDDSPFDLAGLHIEARGDEAGITLELAVPDPSLILELQRRITRQVEETSRPQHEE